MTSQKGLKQNRKCKYQHKLGRKCTWTLPQYHRKITTKWIKLQKWPKQREVDQTKSKGWKNNHSILTLEKMDKDVRNSS